jgi:hypothetical protein
VNTSNIFRAADEMPVKKKVEPAKDIALREEVTGQPLENRIRQLVLALGGFSRALCALSSVNALQALKELLEGCIKVLRQLDFSLTKLVFQRRPIAL